jgi:hypothetical protein
MDSEPATLPNVSGPDELGPDVLTPDQSGFGRALASRVGPRSGTLRHRHASARQPGGLAARIVGFGSLLGLSLRARWSAQRQLRADVRDASVRPPVDYWPWDEQFADTGGSTLDTGDRRVDQLAGSIVRRQRTDAPRARRGLPIALGRGGTTLAGLTTAPGAIAQRMMPDGTAGSVSASSGRASKRQPTSAASRSTTIAEPRRSAAGVEQSSVRSGSEYQQARPSAAPRRSTPSVVASSTSSSGLPRDLAALQRTLLRRGMLNDAATRRDEEATPSTTEQQRSSSPASGQARASGAGQASGQAPADRKSQTDGERFVGRVDSTVLRSLDRRRSPPPVAGHNASGGDIVSALLGDAASSSDVALRRGNSPTKPITWRAEPSPPEPFAGSQPTAHGARSKGGSNRASETAPTPNSHGDEPTTARLATRDDASVAIDAADHPKQPRPTPRPSPAADTAAPGTAATPSVAPPAVVPPSAAPPRVVPPAVVPRNVAPPSAAPRTAAWGAIAAADMAIEPVPRRVESNALRSVARSQPRPDDPDAGVVGGRTPGPKLSGAIAHQPTTARLATLDYAADGRRSTVDQPTWSLPLAEAGAATGLAPRRAESTALQSIARPQPRPSAIEHAVIRRRISESPATAASTDETAADQFSEGDFYALGAADPSGARPKRTYPRSPRFVALDRLPTAPRPMSSMRRVRDPRTTGVLLRRTAQSVVPTATVQRTTAINRRGNTGSASGLSLPGWQRRTATSDLDSATQSSATPIAHVVAQLGASPLIDAVGAFPSMANASITAASMAAMKVQRQPVDRSVLTPDPDVSPWPTRAPVDPGARFLGELDRHRAEQPRPLPPRLQPLATAIIGERPVRVSTGERSRQALAVVGKVAATTGDVIHLDRPVTAVSAEVLAHELTHVAHPSPQPRFFADDRDSAEERRAEHVAAVMRHAPILPRTAAAADTVARTTSVAPAMARLSNNNSSSSNNSSNSSNAASGAISATALAARITGNTSSTSNGVIQRWKDGNRPRSASLGSHRLAASDRPSQLAMQPSSQPQAAPPVPEPQPDAPPSYETYAQESSPVEPSSSTTALANFDQILEMLEERIIGELERRGGRFRGGF